MKVRWFILLLVSTLTLVAMGDQGPPSDNLSSMKPSELPPPLRDSWNAFMADKRGALEFFSAMESARIRYAKAIIELEDKIASCSAKTVDLSWYERAKSMFGKNEIEKREMDFKRAIGVKYIEVQKLCMGTTKRDVLYAESELLAFLPEFLDLLNTFSGRLSNQQRELLKPTIDEVSQVRNAYPSPLQMLLNPVTELKALERKKTFDPKIWQFVSKDSAFQKPFSLSKIIEQFKKKVN